MKKKIINWYIGQIEYGSGEIQTQLIYEDSNGVLWINKYQNIMVAIDGIDYKLID